MAFVQTIPPSLREELSAQDRRLDDLLQDLLRHLSMTAHRSPRSEATWGRLERRIVRRLEAEETFLLPTFGCTLPAEAAALHEDHAKLRYQLADLRAWVGSSGLRAQEVKHLLTLFRTTVSRKEETLYPWVDQLDGEVASLLAPHLS